MVDANNVGDATSELNENPTEEVEAQESEQAEATGDAPRTFTQEDVSAIAAKQAAKRKRDLAASNQVAEEAQRKAAALEEKNRLLELALSQRNESGPPNPDSFDAGEVDPAYIKAAAEYNAKMVAETVQKQLAEHAKTTAEQAQQSQRAGQLQERQQAHYKQALDLIGADYEAAEDAVTSLVGTGVVDGLIEKDSRSAEIIFWLSKNSGDADAKAFVEAAGNGDHYTLFTQIGAIKSKLDAKAPTSSKAPDPDEPLQGGAAPMSKLDGKFAKLQKDYEAGKITGQELLRKRKELRAAS